MTITTNYQTDKCSLLTPEAERNKKRKKSVKLGKAWKSIAVSVKKKKFSSSHLKSSTFEVLSKEDRFAYLSSRYLVTKEQLFEKQSEGNEALTTYLKKKNDKYGKVLDQAIVDYKKIISNYNISDEVPDSPGQLVPIHNSGHTPRGLSKRLLMKIVRKSALTLYEKPKDFQLGASFQLLSYPHWNILTQRKNKELQIYKWCGKRKTSKDTPCFLGRGSYGFIHKVENIAKACFSILKVAYGKDQEQQVFAEKGLVNEAQKLSYIHQKKVVDGIVEPPLCFFFIPGSTFNFTAYTQKLYNLKDIIECVLNGDINPKTLTKREGLLIIKSLYTALKTLQKESHHREAIIHGDLKADNILVERTPEGDIRFVIGDFGDAKFTKRELINADLKVCNNLPLATVTSLGSFTKTDWNKLDKALKDGNRKLWIELQKKRDLFALTAAIWVLISGEPPYDMSDHPDDNMFPDTRNMIHHMEFVTRKYGNQVTLLLTRTLSENPHGRPSLKTILKVIDHELD